MTIKPFINVHHAWMFDCEECGRENFVRAVTLDIDDDAERLAAAKELGIIEEWENEVPQGSFESYPDGVKCEHCGAEFSTIPEGLQ